MKHLKKWRPVILSAAFLLSIVLIMLTIIHHFKVHSILDNERGYYIEHHIFFDKIYIGSKGRGTSELKIISIKKTKKLIIIKTNSIDPTCYIGLCPLYKTEYKTTSKYLHIPSNKTVIVLDNYGNEMQERK